MIKNLKNFIFMNLFLIMTSFCMKKESSMRHKINERFSISIENLSKEKKKNAYVYDLKDNKKHIIEDIGHLGHIKGAFIQDNRFLILMGTNNNWFLIKDLKWDDFASFPVKKFVGYKVKIRDNKFVDIIYANDEIHSYQCFFKE